MNDLVIYTKWTRQSVRNYRVENELIYVYIRTQDEHRCVNTIFGARRSVKVFLLKYVKIIK